MSPKPQGAVSILRAYRVRGEVLGRCRGLSVAAAGFQSLLPEEPPPLPLESLDFVPLLFKP